MLIDNFEFLLCALLQYSIVEGSIETKREEGKPMAVSLASGLGTSGQ